MKAEMILLLLYSMFFWDRGECRPVEMIEVNFHHSTEQCYYEFLGYELGEPVTYYL